MSQPDSSRGNSLRDNDHDGDEKNEHDEDEDDTNLDNSDRKQIAA